MRTRALLLLLGFLATGAFARRAAARWRESARPLDCDRVVGLIDGDAERLACADELSLSRCTSVRSGHRYSACREEGPLRGALLRLCGQAVDVSTATAEDLTGLPGIGPGMAARVIQTRKQHRLCTLEDLRQVSGIGPRRLEALAGHVVFSDPLCATPPSK